MTQLPNIITQLRIAGSLGLLLCDVTSVAYWIIYALCGISDIGHVACLVPVIIAWCYWPGVKEKARM